MAITTEIINVTPDMAAEWLEHNTHNRHIREDAVRALARAMENGQWRLTHQGIAFDENGTLLDGQHRLWAVFESGCTVPMMVTKGMPPESGEKVDLNLKRTTKDVITLKHSDKPKDDPMRDRKVIAVATRILSDEYEKAGVRHPNAEDIEGWMLEHPMCIAFLSGMHKTYKGMSKPALYIAALGMAVNNVPLKHIAAFYDILISNKLPTGETRYNLSAALGAKDTVRSGKGKTDEVVQYVQSAFYLFYEDRSRLPHGFAGKIIYPLTAAKIREAEKRMWVA